MNFGQERFQWLEQDPYTREKMPFYMTYPMQNTVFEETEYEKDCKRLPGNVSERCQKDSEHGG